MRKIEQLEQQIASGKMPVDILEKKKRQLEYLKQEQSSVPKVGWLHWGFPYHQQVTYWYEGKSLITKSTGVFKRFNLDTIINRVIPDEEAQSYINQSFEVGQVWESPIDESMVITSIDNYLHFDDFKILPVHFIKEFINDQYFQYKLKGDTEYKDYNYYLTQEIKAYEQRLGI